MIKKLRIWFNIIWYSMVVPSLFNILVDFKGFIMSIKLEPAIIIAIIVVLSAFLFMIYKARKYKKEIVLLNNRLDLRIDYEYTGTANYEMFISDVQFIIDNCKEINDDATYLIIILYLNQVSGI